MSLLPQRVAYHQSEETKIWRGFLFKETMSQIHGAKNPEHPPVGFVSTTCGTLSVPASSRDSFQEKRGSPLSKKIQTRSELMLGFNQVESICSGAGKNLEHPTGGTRMNSFAAQFGREITRKENAEDRLPRSGAGTSRSERVGVGISQLPAEIQGRDGIAESAGGNFLTSKLTSDSI